MLASIIANRPTLFAHIFPRIMDEEVTFHTASEEKLRSRLLLAGACCRQTLNEYSFPVLNLLKNQSAILNYDRKLIYHKDMKVRKAYCKFLKDMLRGLVGTFPIDLPTPMAQRSFALAGPNIPVKSGIIWNHPSAATIGFVVEVLKLFSHQIKEEISLALETATSPLAADSAISAKEGEKVSAKKCEEMISANLTVLLKMLRGTADLLGDVITVNGKPQLLYIITTGREFLYQQISEEDRFFLCSYRSEVFKFLHTIKENLREISESSPYFILYNHAVIAKLWMKVFKISLTRRVSYLKNPDNLITGHAFQKQLDNATLHRTIYDHLKHRTLIGQLPKEGRGENDVMNLKYWKFHDRVSNWIGFKTWLQHSIRCHLMAENSIEVLYTPRSSQYSIDDNAFLTGFRDIYALAAHEYNYIGSKATVLYAQLTFICRSKLLYEVLKNLLKYLDSPTINYYELLCVTEVIKTNGVFSRLAGLLDLKLILFQALPKLQSAIARITDLQKQETAMLSLSYLLIGYTTVWTHYKDELAQLHNVLVPLILSYFGFSSYSNNDDEVMNVEVSAKSGGNGNNSSHRFDLFYGYLLLHLADSSMFDNLSIQNWKLIWQLIVKTLLKGYFQPLQLIMEALTIRLVEMLFLRYQENPDETSRNEKYLFVKDLLSSPSSFLSWPKLLHSFVYARSVVSGVEDDPDEGRPSIWGPMLDPLDQAVEFLKVVKTRFFTTKMFEFNLSSDSFDKEVSSAFYSMVQCRIVNFLDDATHLQDFFQVLKEIPYTNEGEKKAINYLQAEIFAAFFRSFLKNREAKKNAKELNGAEVFDEESEDIKIEKVFCQFLLGDILDCLPLEYGQEWQEAISFALDDTVVEKLGLLHHAILDLFQQALRETSSFDPATLNPITEEDDEENNEGLQELEEGVVTYIEEEMRVSHIHAGEQAEVDDVNNEEEMEIEDDEEQGEDVVMEEAEEEAKSTERVEMPKRRGVMEMDDGFSRQSKIFMFVFGLLNGDCIARATTLSSTYISEERLKRRKVLLVANEVFQIVIHPQTNLLSPYNTSRYEFASIINTLIDFFSYQHALKGSVTSIFVHHLHLLYAKIIGGVDLSSNNRLPPLPAIPSTPAVPPAGMIANLMTRSNDSFAHSPPAPHLSDDGSSSPPRKKTMIAPSSSSAAFHRSWDQESLTSSIAMRSGSVNLTYSTDSSVSIPSHIDVKNAGAPSSLTTPSSLLLRSTDSNNHHAMRERPPRPSIPHPPAQSMIVEEENEAESEKRQAEIASEVKRQQKMLKQTVDTIHHILRDILRWIPIQWITSALQTFFPVLVEGVIHSEEEVSNKSVNALQLIFSCLFPSTYLAGSSSNLLSEKDGEGRKTNEGYYQSWIDQLMSLYDAHSFSWKIKAVLLQVSVQLLLQHWFFLSVDQRQTLKTWFMNGMKDEQLNIRGVASSGMILYLGFKTPKELKEIAELYTRNSEKLATREKNRRRMLKSSSRDSHDTTRTGQLSVGGTTVTGSMDSQWGPSIASFGTGQPLPHTSNLSSSALPDSEYALNIQMMSCIVLTRPYDLPSYLPKLIGSFLRHRHYYDVNKLTITKTIQAFQESHHDRWEEFQLAFTSEQLMDLQGVGAAYYFA
eukprot:CAMPEP_0173158880 /NCGR_PEP_ID=MMETSP1105-20130129/16723_1 /TAXON_ID=2985 /ORGANISM="Ochromonas sp., Strain BG-1" /LENGTH=1612 /DNA_ID=CAMNT_0014077099 /DNA_START=2116 /DNA_END=6954 /DNA_ORIENTATION=+